MKFSMKYILTIATAVVALISGYQTYWLINIYQNLDATQQKDLKEAVRAADFEEIVHRVTQMQNEHVGGSMQISVGANPEEKSTTLKTERRRSLDSNETETNLDTNLPANKFNDALKNADDVMNVGLSMQSGIHSGLDKMQVPDFRYYEKVLSMRLDSLGISVPHTTLYIKTDRETQKCDTLEKSGRMVADADTFRLMLDINANTEYVLLVPKRNYGVLKQMKAPLLYSVVTLLVLLLAFVYIINIIKSMKQLDEMKSDFTNNITHELKTPIAVTYAAVDSMLNFNGADDPQRSRKYLRICQDQLNLLTKLVEQILSMSMDRRNMLLDIDDVEVKPIVQKLIDNQKIKSENAIFEVDIPDGMTVKGDAMHLSNIISNLIDNAIKYSKDNPRVSICAALTADGRKEISVKDNGIGISKENQKFIFLRFYRVPHGNLHNVKGYGLGLYYVKSIMEKFGGNISVDSEINKGSTFKLHFNG